MKFLQLLFLQKCTKSDIAKRVGERLLRGEMSNKVATQTTSVMIRGYVFKLNIPSDIRVISLLMSNLLVFCFSSLDQNGFMALFKD